MSETRFLAFARRQRLSGDAITVRAAGGQASFAFHHYGPGDVAGLATGQVRRREPAAGSRAMPPNLFPYVEFEEPDFPWRLSPGDPSAAGQIIPWLALVTLELTAGGEPLLRHVGNGELPVVEVACKALPPSDELALWAHVEIAPSGTTVPEGGIARIVSPARLQPLRHYLCCLVPTFESGRLAGLGEVPPDPLDPTLAWTDRDGTVVLPVYDSWQFATMESGDVETLARNLKPEVLQARPFQADVSEALRPARSADTPPPTLVSFDPVLRPAATDPQWSPKSARQRARTTIGGWLKRTASGTIGPPIYGAATGGQLADSGWMGDVNLDPVFRAAAGIGAAMVAAHQDDLSEEAWRQAGAIQKARREDEGAKLAGLVANRLFARSVAPLSDVAATLTLRPALARVSAPGGGPLTAALAQSALPSANLSAVFGRILKAKGMRRSAAVPLTTTLQALNQKIAVLNELPPTSPSVATRARIGAFQTGGGSRPSRSTITAVRPGSAGRTTVSGATSLRSGTMAALPLQPSTRFASLNVVLDVEKARMVEAAAPWLDGRAPAVVEVPTPSAFDWTAPPRPGDVAQAGAGRRTELGDGGRRVPGRGVSLAPRFDQPLADWFAPRFLLGEVEPDPETVCGLGVNASFIEAVMIGANHELARELRWRGVPLDLSATFFRRFFDGEVSLSDMAVWQSTPLGEHYPVAQSTVVFFRSKLVEHLSEVAVFLVRAKRVPGSGRIADPAAGTIPPFFQGRPGPGMAYFGFDVAADALRGSAADPGWYLVIEEKGGGTKFGFDEQSAPLLKTWDDVAWPDLDAARGFIRAGAKTPEPATPGDLQWGRNGAHMAAICRQKPFRLVVHASLLIG